MRTNFIYITKSVQCYSMVKALVLGKQSPKFCLDKLQPIKMKWLCTVAVIAAVFCDQVCGDTQCKARGGSCQDVGTPCRGGQYFRNLCAGSSNRRCCVPIGSSGCMRVTQDLACEVFRSSRVTAAQRHPSGYSDNAYAYNNLRDLCNGVKASRSSYKCSKKCNAPGGSTCLSYNLLKYLAQLKDSGNVKINEIAGACHSCESRHFSGLAVDLNPGGRAAEYIKKCKSNGGTAINEGTHIHCQFYDGQHPNWK